MKNNTYLKRAVTFVTAVILMASMIISGFSASLIYTVAASDVWDGTAAAAYAGGSGTSSDPYLITNAAQLYKMVSENGTNDGSTVKYFKLSNSIYINDISKENWSDSATPWYTAKGSSYYFNDDFDGAGFTVYGLYVVASDTRAGLFPQLSDGAVISNLRINNAVINGTKGRSGVIAGTVQSLGNKAAVSIKKCSVENATVNDRYAAGGIVGTFTASCTISDCYFNGTLKCTDKVTGGIVPDGWSSSCTINNCYSVGAYPVSGNNTKNYTISNTYTNVASASKTSSTVKNITSYASDETKMKGEAAKTNLKGFDFDSVWQAVDNSYPILQNPSANKYWNGKAADSYEGGSGTSSDPYLIANAAQLYKMVSENGTNDGSSPLYFMLTNDIYINNVGIPNWQNESPTPWYTASGTSYFFNDYFDGAGFTIYGLYVKSSGSRAGLFPQLSDGAVVCNVRICHAAVSGTTGRSGVIAGVVQPLGNKAAVSIRKCSIENATVNDRYAAGGIIGTFTASCTISDCYFNGTLKCTDKVTGGIMPDGWSATCTIKNCYSVGAYPVSGNNTKNYTISNVYTNIASASKSSSTVKNITSYSDDETKMQGEAAKTNLKGFDFDTVWQTVDNGYPILQEPAVNKYWNGKAADSYAGGNGTADDPYKISNAAQLYKMVSENGENDGSSPLYFILTNDIYINDVEIPDWQNESPTPWYTASGTNYYFNDYFEGAGFTIYGLYIKSGGSRAGLFPQLSDGAVVCNVRISHAAVSGTAGRSGVIAGAIQNLGAKTAVSISGCAVENATVSDRYAAGGIIGTFVSSCVITDSYFNGTLKSTEKITGGIAPDGWSSSCTIKNCYSVGAYPVSGNNSKCFTVTNVYTNIATASKTERTFNNITSFTGKNEAKMKGDAAKTNLTGFDFEKTWSITEGYPKLVKRIGDGTVYDTKKPGEIWSGNPSKNYAGGTGTEADPYLIETAGQLAKLVKESISGSTVGKHYKLIHDIYLNDTSSENWTDTANQWYTTNYFRNCFRGTFDGNGHIVSGMYIYVKRQENTYAGLFPSLGEDGVIKNVGVVNSEILLDGTLEMHAGAITGFINIYEIEKISEDRYPRISQCFADSTVTVEAKFPGGILASAGRPVIIENCFFTGDTASYYGSYGSILGYTWMSYGGIKIINCYAAKQSLGTKISEDKFSVGEYVDCYSSGPQANVGINRVYINIMRGEAAKDSMNKLDFENIWVTRENETPGLKIFDKASYSTTNNSDNVTLSFVTNCDITVEPMSGVAYTSFTLPVPEREGYEFAGWYTYPELDVKYNMDTFPSFSTNLYAKWELTGINANFENYPNTEYDLGEDYELYRPSLSNYDAAFVHTGARSIHRIGDTDGDSDFLVFYEDELTVGDTYKMTFWLSTDQNTADVDISLVHATWPDVNEANLGVEKVVTATGLTNGSWQQYTYTFTAKTKWISIRTSGGNSIYLDDFFLTSIASGNSSNSNTDVTIPDTGSTEHTNLFNALITVMALSAVLCLLSGKKLYNIKKQL